MSEVDHVLRILGEKRPPLGVWFDMEDGDYYKSKNNSPLSRENGQMYSEICRTFCQKMIDSGFGYCGVYASKYILENVLSISDLNIWLAQWANCVTFNGKYDFWQCSSVGKVDGIDGNVDIDFCYKNFDVFRSVKENE